MKVEIDTFLTVSVLLISMKYSSCNDCLKMDDPIYLHVGAIWAYPKLFFSLNYLNPFFNSKCYTLAFFL